MGRHSHVVGHTALTLRAEPPVRQTQGIRTSYAVGVWMSDARHRGRTLLAEHAYLVRVCRGSDAVGSSGPSSQLAALVALEGQRRRPSSSISAVPSY